MCCQFVDLFNCRVAKLWLARRFIFKFIYLAHMQGILKILFSSSKREGNIFYFPVLFRVLSQRNHLVFHVFATELKRLLPYSKCLKSLWVPPVWFRFLSWTLMLRNLWFLVDRHKKHLPSIFKWLSSSIILIHWAFFSLTSHKGF